MTHLQQQWSRRTEASHSSTQTQTMHKRVTFIYARHGRTVYNRDHIIQGGRVDSPLAEESLWQVYDSAKALQDIELTRCYVSPLGRARQTADILLKGRRIEAQVLDSLHEFDFGLYDGVAYAGRSLRFSYHFVIQNFASVGGERGVDVIKRVRSSFEHMYSEAQDGDTILVVAHGALFRYVLLAFSKLPWPLRKLRSELLRVPNAGLALIEADEQGFNLQTIALRPQEFLEQAGKRGLLTQK